MYGTFISGLQQKSKVAGFKKKSSKLQPPHQRNLPAQRLVEENAHLKNC
jgi:hypothetical protein